MDTEMMAGANASSWFDDLPVTDEFASLTDKSMFSSMPSDWLLGLADVVNSTGLAKQGRYKEINMVGAAVISAQLNSLGGVAFPFSFAGDGSFFACSPEQESAAAMALREVKRWALEEFDIELRVALVPVADVLANGHEVQVARYRASSGADYSMFRGGGTHWAEQQMKAGRYELELAPLGAVPNLEGLSCRWMPMPSSQGEVISLVVYRHEDASDSDYKGLLQQLLSITQRLERAGHPVPEEGPSVGWPPAGLELESHASRGTKSLLRRNLELLGSTFIAWLFFKFDLKAGDFDATHYARTVSANADFRKFQDGLKMTLDCDLATEKQLIAVLESGVQKQVIRYGLSRQESAIMTCIVPSVTTDDHIHFIDGAGGGYTLAEAELQ